MTEVTEKKYGIYPGSSNNIVKYLNECSEIEFFLILDAYKKRLRNFKIMQRERILPLESKLAYYNDEYVYNYAIYATRRFGVNIKLPLSNEKIPTDGEFLKWFMWWFAYVYETLTDKERETIGKAINSTEESAKLDLSNYRPSGTWKDYTSPKKPRFEGTANEVEKKLVYFMKTRAIPVPLLNK